MKYSPKWPLTAITLLILSSCGGGGSVGTDNQGAGSNSDDTASAVGASLPRSLKQNNDTDDSSDDSDDSDESENDDAHSVVTTSAQETGALLAADDATYTLAHPMMLADVGMLQDQMYVVNSRLDYFDTVWTDLQSFCESVADGAVCDIPAGTLAEPEADDSIAIDYDDQSQEQESVAQPRLEYVRNSSDEYAHQITVFSAWAEGSDLEEYRWNSDKSRVLSKAKGNWSEDGVQSNFSADQLYTSSDAGEQVTLREAYDSGQERFSSSQQLHTKNDAKNAIELKTESSWSTDTDKGSYSATVIANDDGGQSGSIMTSEADGTTYTFHTRNEFNADGELTSSQYCDSSAGTDCANPANWTRQDLDQETPESAFDGSIVSIEGSDELIAAHKEACEELELDEEQCELLEQPLIDGTDFEFENIEDLCEELEDSEAYCVVAPYSSSEATSGSAEQTDSVQDSSDSDIDVNSTSPATSPAYENDAEIDTATPGRITDEMNDISTCFDENLPENATEADYEVAEKLCLPELDENDEGEDSMEVIEIDPESLDGDYAEISDCINEQLSDSDSIEDFQAAAEQCEIDNS